VISSGIHASAPAGSWGEAGQIVTKADGHTAPPEEGIPTPLVIHTEFPAGHEPLLGGLHDSPSEPTEKEDLGHVQGSVATTTAVVLLDAFLSASPTECKAQGTVISLPR
jgi:hypothetical protein